MQVGEGAEQRPVTNIQGGGVAQNIFVSSAPPVDYAPPAYLSRYQAENFEPPDYNATVVTEPSIQPWWLGPLILAGSSAVLAAPGIAITAVAAGGSALAAAGAAASAVGTGGKLLNMAETSIAKDAATIDAQRASNGAGASTATTDTPAAPPPPFQAAGLSDVSPLLWVGAAALAFALLS